MLKYLVLLSVGLNGTLVAPVALMAQTTPGDAWGIVASYGAAAPFALLCLWVIKRLLTEIDTLRKENAVVTAAGMSQVVPALVRATEQQKEAGEVLATATTQIHQLLARSPDALTLDRIYRALNSVEARLNANDR